METKLHIVLYLKVIFLGARWRYKSRVVYARGTGYMSWSLNLEVWN